MPFLSQIHLQFLIPAPYLLHETTIPSRDNHGPWSATPIGVPITWSLWLFQILSALSSHPFPNICFVFMQTPLNI
jgi:hypothetical protein